jgi:hypothetical protein
MATVADIGLCSGGTRDVMLLVVVVVMAVVVV